MASMNMKRKKLFAVAAFLAVFAAVFGAAFAARANILDDFVERFIGPRPVPETTVKEPSPPPPVSYRATAEYEEAVISAVEAASPAVVSVIVTKDLSVIENCPFNPFEDLPPEFRQFFGPFEFERPCERRTRRQEVGGGSGFIVSQDGLLVTNKHVVSDAGADYTVLTNDGKKYPAEVVARDPVQDLALVRIKGGNTFRTVKLGDSDSIRLGQTAIAIGNALGEFRNTVSVGIISGLARAIEASDGGSGIELLEGLIQTDAAINPGNSGGPLLNLRGEVVGVNTAVARGAENIGFAIPINKAKRDIESVKRSGKITAPYLGVRYLLVNEELKEREKLSLDYGAIIRGSEEGPGIFPDSPAARAGLQAEDIILELNGERVSFENPLASLILKYNVGDAVRLTVLRSGKRITLTAILGERE